MKTACLLWANVCDLDLWLSRLNCLVLSFSPLLRVLNSRFTVSVPSEQDLKPLEDTLYKRSAELDVSLWRHSGVATGGISLIQVWQSSKIVGLPQTLRSSEWPSILRRDCNYVLRGVPVVSLIARCPITLEIFTWACWHFAAGSRLAPDSHAALGWSF